MNIDLPFILVWVTFLSGLIWLTDSWLFAHKRQQQATATGVSEKLPLLVDYSRSFFPLLIIVLILRSFVFQPYRVPSGSLEPTVVAGDFMAVNMYQYGLRLPLTYKKILEVHSPKIGDIMLFRWPANHEMNFIKRVIGVPGDHISYINKVLYVNGKEAKQTFITNAMDNEYPDQPGVLVEKRSEDLNGVKHYIYINPAHPSDNFYNLAVPAGKYFMMGDNRDGSDDSRYWGFVSNDEIIGKAFGILLSWDNIAHRIRWNRIGIKL